MMTTTAAHNSARQYMQHDNEDRMQVWHREQLQLPIPNPRPATNGQHSSPQSPQEISKYEGNTYCLPQPSIMTAHSTHDMMEELQWTSFSVVRVSDWIVV